MRPRVFIGSSEEGRRVASAIQANLENEAETTVWDQDLLQASKSTLDALWSQLASFDFGIFVLSFEDTTQRRGKKQKTSRDNVIFELGMFIGAFGAERTFIVTPANIPNAHLPTNLSGIIRLEYNPDRQDDNMRAALGPASDAIAHVVRMSGRRSASSSVASSSFPKVYPSVADARPDIIAEIVRLGSRSNNQRILVQVLGYRLRDVRSLLFHVFDGALNGTRRIENVDFKVFHVDPDYLEHLPLPRNLPMEAEPQYRKRMRAHAITIRSNMQDFAKYASSNEFRELGLTCELVSYRSYPTLCVYLIHEEVAFIGTFNWNDEDGDIGGARHPCFRIERNQELVSRLIPWCANRAKLLEQWRG